MFPRLGVSRDLNTYSYEEVGAAESRKRVERGFIWIFCILQLVVPPLVIDFYPFTTMPMYSDSLRRISLFSVKEDAGAELSLVDFQLQSNYLANPVARIGRKQAPTLNTLPEIIPDQVLLSHVRDRLRHYPCVKAATVTQRIYGALERQGRATAGVVDQKSWDVENQFYACGGQK